MTYHRPENIYDKLNWVGKIMIDTAKVMAAGGVNIPPSYHARILNNRKRHATPEV